MNMILLNKKHAYKYWELRLEALRESPEAFITTYQEAIQKVNPILETSQRLESEHNFTFGAFYKDHLVGVITMLRQAHPKFRHKADLLAMYVIKDARGQGIAVQLLEKIKKQATDIGIEQLQLQVVSSNTPAKDLYNKVGFVTYGTEKQAIKLNEKAYEDEEMMVFFTENIRTY